MNILNKAFFCSWSGGKDSCLSLYYAIQQGGRPERLITMLIDNGERSRSHGLSINLLNRQAELLGIPISTYATSWEDYETNFLNALQELKDRGISIGIFGDIDIEDHKHWVQQVCSKKDMTGYLPLWKKSRENIVTEFIEEGFEAVIVAVKNGLSLHDYLGKELTLDLINEFKEIGIDPAGENGEYHTVVTGGPIFKKRLKYGLKEQRLVNGYWFQDINTLVFQKN